MTICVASFAHFRHVLLHVYHTSAFFLLVNEFKTVDGNGRVEFAEQISP